MIRAVGAVPGVERLRLSSIEVDHLGAPVIAALAETPAALPHLHVPMQSGDDAVLRAMRRRAPAARYAERIAAARAAIDGLNVTADVIVGFPGEDGAAFGRTIDLVRETGLTRVHAFPYSPRPGTRTGDDDPVPAEVKRERGEEAAPGGGRAGPGLAGRARRLDRRRAGRAGRLGRSGERLRSGLHAVAAACPGRDAGHGRRGRRSRGR